MPKYRVTGVVIGSKYLGEFEAATEDDAIELALGTVGSCVLCNQCTSECDDPSIESGYAEEVAE